MIDTLLHFDDEVAALAILAAHHGEAGCSGEFLPVVLVTAEAEFGEPNEEGLPVMIAEREIRPGFWVLSCAPDLDAPAEVIAASIERETGRILSGDESLAGSRLDPAWAGAEPILSIAVVEPEPPAVPDAISDRQFAQQLAILGTITEAEALAWAARGELPEAMEVAIAALPEENRFGARMLLSSATTYERAHPLVPLLGGLLGYDEAETDDLWRAAVAL